MDPACVRWVFVSLDEGDVMGRGTERGGFSLVELVTVVGALGAAVGLTIPAGAALRGVSNEMRSRDNLREIGAGYGSFANANDGRIAAFNERGGEFFFRLGRAGAYKSRAHDFRQAQAWSSGIMIWNDFEFEDRRDPSTWGYLGAFTNDWQLVNFRSSHIVLADFLDVSVFDDLWADPADANLLGWKSDPFEYINEGSRSSFPYAGEPDEGSHGSYRWDEFTVINTWAAASSYQVVPHAWQVDSGSPFYPRDDTPHWLRGRLGLEGVDDTLGERRVHEVRTPSLKVHMFEEFDREDPDELYFAYDTARPAKLMFDGSINTDPSGGANSSVNPVDYDKGLLIPWEQEYVHLDTFPRPVTYDDPLNMRYRWTAFGLRGIDYGLRGR
jgi:hypothetical protein